MNETTIRIIFESQIAYLPLLRKAVYGMCSCMIQNEEILYDISLCLHEAVANIICHAYQNESGHEIQVIVTLSPEEAKFQIIDLGLKNQEANMNHEKQIEFDPNNLDTLSETGRGLFIIHHLMDEVIYKSAEGKNVLFLRKCLT